MGSQYNSIEEFSFEGDKVSAVGASALRRVTSLSEMAPKGRLFAAITTLRDVGIPRKQSYEAV